MRGISAEGFKRNFVCPENTSRILTPNLFTAANTVIKPSIILTPANKTKCKDD